MNTSAPRSRIRAALERITQPDSQAVKEALIDSYRWKIVEIGKTLGAEVLEDRGCNEGMDSLERGWFRSPKNRPFDIDLEGYRLQVLPARSIPRDRIELFRKDPDGEIKIGGIGFGVGDRDDLADILLPSVSDTDDMAKIHMAANDLIASLEAFRELYRAAKPSSAPAP